MELQQLQYFQTVARLEHMTQAAEALNITQPALSRTISRLEAEVGVPLFDRKGRQIQLNAFGQIFLRHLERSFQELEQAQKRINDLAGLENRSVLIGTTNVNIFPSLVASFIEQYPNARIRQFLRTDQEMGQLLEAGEIDLCISASPIVGQGIEWTPFFQDELLLLVPLEERFMHRKEIALIEVAHEKFIGGGTSNEASNWLEELCRAAGFAPDVFFEGSDSVVVAEMVSRGLGISFIPKYLWTRFSEVLQKALHVLQITDPDCTITTGVSRMKDRYLPATAQAFYDFILRKDWEPQ